MGTFFGRDSGPGSRRPLRRFAASVGAFGAVLSMPLTALAAQAAEAATDPPLATTDSASGIASAVATLNGKVNPNGSAVASCRFEYGTTTAYGAVSRCQPASLGTGSSNVPVTAQLDGLEAGTTYHYRLVAANANGASIGADRTFSTSGSPACPNADRRLEQGIRAILLPDCMALEQVSVPKKWGARAQSPTVSADGKRVAYRAMAALADAPGWRNPIFGDIYVASRDTEQGWSSSSASPPQPFKMGWGGTAELPRSFDPSLSRWLVLGSTPEQFRVGAGQLYRGGFGGLFEPLSPMLVSTDGVPYVGDELIVWTSLLGASADHSRAVLGMGEPAATYLPGDPVPSGAEFDGNVYLAALDAAGDPSLALLNRDQVGPDAGKAWGENCGARLGGVTAAARRSVRGGGWRNQGAVSSDGSTIYFSARAAQPAGGPCNPDHPFRILVRTEAVSGQPDVTHLVPNDGVGECTRVAPACSTADGNDLFQGASVDGSRVYFTTTRQLADSDLDEGFGCLASFALVGCDLYLYDAERPEGERLVQVSAGEVAPGHAVPGEGAAVYDGTVAISADGSRVYFAAAGNLTAQENPEGVRPSDIGPATPKLYVWDTDSETVRFIGPLAGADEQRKLWGGDGTFLNDAYPVPVTGAGPDGDEVGGDGHVLLFRSHSSLTANDADGGHLDVFRYDDAASPPSLACVSCAPGGPDTAPIDITGDGPPQPNTVGTGYAEAGRWVSEDGSRVIFRTEQSLLSGDVNDRRDAYLWSGGRLSLLPGTTKKSAILTSDHGERPPTMSHDGGVIAFSSYERLLPSDGDTAPDVYVARVGGGFAQPSEVPTCRGEDCQGPSTPPPPLPQVGSITFGGDGNVPLVPDPVKVSVGVSKLRAVSGSAASLKVRVPDAGRILLAGSSIRRTSKSASKAGTYSVKIKLKPRVKRLLRKRKRLRVSARVSYRAKDGQSASKTISVTFKLRRATRRAAKRNGHTRAKSRARAHKRRANASQGGSK